MKSDFFCCCCGKHYQLDKLGGHISKKPYCAMCYVGKVKRAEDGRYESLKPAATPEQKSEIKEYRKKVHARSAEAAFQQELARIEREMVSYEY